MNKLLDATVEIARNKQTQVTLFNVSQEYVSNGMTYLPENFLEEILNEMEKASLEQLQQAKSKLESAGIKPEHFILKEILTMKY